MRKIGISLVLAVTLLVAFAFPVGATNPTVAITVTAQVVSITNSKATWGIGTVTVDQEVYFSTDGTQDDDWSTITNTGSVAVDVEIQGTDIEGGLYDWVLSATGVAASETYGLNATSTNGTGTYDVVVKSAAYNDLTTDLATDATWLWSMLFNAPTAFNAADDGNQKTSTLTLVASKHV